VDTVYYSRTCKDHLGSPLCFFCTVSDRKVF